MIKAAVVFVALCVVLTQAADENTITTIRFQPHQYTVEESIGTFKVNVVREGKAPTGNIVVKYASADGSAKAGSDYEQLVGTLTFTPDDKELTIEVKIINDTVAESTEEFFINLVEITSNGSAVFGEQKKAKIIILDDDKETTSTASTTATAPSS